MKRHTLKRKLIGTTALALGAISFSYSAYAHGGTYRGPEDIRPPGGGGGTAGGPTTPGPGGPGVPGPAGPTGPGPTSPSGPAGTPSVGAPTGQNPRTGDDLGPDFTTWDYWWGFNKGQYLNLKVKTRLLGTVTGKDDWAIGRGDEAQSRASLKPSDQQIRSQVVPALKATLANERGNDLITGSLIALAKIGDTTSESDSSEFEAIIKAFLKDGNQEIAETAAIALGILAHDSSIEILSQLLNDAPVARKFLGKTEVPLRTRAFAAYGLGLIGYRTSDNTLRQEIGATLVRILNSPNFAQRDVKVAAMTAFGLVPVDLALPDATAPEGLTPNAAAAISRQAQLEFLLEYYDQAGTRAHSRTRHYHVRAHAPTAMARLLNANGTETFKLESLRTQVIAKLLEGVEKNSKYNRLIQQSCVLALGQIVDARGGETLGLHGESHRELMRVIKDGDQQSRRFALIAISQIAARSAPAGVDDPTGAQATLRKALLSRLDKAKGELRAWAGLAMGVHGRALIDSGQPPLRMGPLSALRARAKKEKNPARAGAYLIGLGLIGDQDSAEILLDKLEYFSGSDAARGQAAVALGLMGYTQATETIQAILQESSFRPDLLKEAAIALGLLGDKRMVQDLVQMLAEAKSLSSQAAIASALGTIGDKNSIDGLIEMLQDGRKTQTARGFAAVALGIVCDKELLPWNSKIGTDINYRANTVTLTGESFTGVLDLL